MKDRQGRPIRVYNRPPCLAFLLLYAFLFALVVWGLFKINDLLLIL